MAWLEGHDGTARRAQWHGSEITGRSSQVVESGMTVAGRGYAGRGREASGRRCGYEVRRESRGSAVTRVGRRRSRGSGDGGHAGSWRHGRGGCWQRSGRCWNEKGRQSVRMKMGV